MNLKNLINKSWYGSIGYIQNDSDIELLGSYLLHNQLVLDEFKGHIFAFTYKELNEEYLENTISSLYPDAIIIYLDENRGHNFGTADLDNVVFDICKDLEVEWLCKASNDIILQPEVLGIPIQEADFYYMNGIGFGGMVKYDFDNKRIINEDFYPQTNFYFINVSKTDYLPASQFMTNVKMKEDTSENVEFAIRLQGDVLVPVDSHFPVEKFKAITDGYDADDKRAVADARAKLATAFKAKAKSVNEKYIVPPKTTDFAIVYAPTESLYKELTEYQDPSTKELLTQELMKKHKVVICGPNTLSAYLQSLHMGFQSLKVQKGATEIYNHLKTISSRFGKHFENIISLRKKLEEAMSVVDKFGTDARSITRTLESIKDPEQLEKAVQTENVEKFVDHSKQAKN